MTQKSIVIANDTGLNVRGEINNALETIATGFTGSSEPATTYPNMIWNDTSGTNTIKKQRNSANDAWVILGNFINGVFYNADRATIETDTITLTTTWSGSEAPYTQAVTVSGILATDNPIIGLIPSSTYETAEAEMKDYSKLYSAVTSKDTITFYAKEATTTALALQVKIIR
jgi:hypothetical protein